MSFYPPRGLRNPHVQTIFSSIGPRRLKLRTGFKQYEAMQQPVLLNCNEGVRLGGFLNQAGERKSSTLAILIHGWEGSAQSSYMVSMTTRLLDAGIDVFRLNMRDHGDTHHLNREIFNSTLVQEVMEAIEDLQQRFTYSSYVLGGFSLGGNFSCRVAAMAHDHRIRLDKVVAFCPVLHANNSNTVLNDRKNWIYGLYFVRKWKKSLRKKLEHYPEYEYGDILDEMKSLDDMNHRLIPVYTQFPDVYEYFDAYAITGDVMTDTICRCYLHFARDDMIIPHEDIEHLADNDRLHITVTDHGGHCGFLMNWQLDSWQDQRMLELITTD